MRKVRAKVCSAAGIVLCVSLLAGLATPSSAQAPPSAKGTVLASSHRQNATGEWAAASPDARKVAAWIVASRDSRGLAYLIIDKRRAMIFTFDAGGRLQGAAPVLLGLARGDDATPGIGSRKLASILPEERTTPAGRFEGALGHNLSATDVVWVDYDTAISLHRVIQGAPTDQRIARLESASSLDNRISYGCINVPVAFYDTFIGPVFRRGGGVIYVLPDTKTVEAVFPLVFAQASLSAGESGSAQRPPPRDVALESDQFSLA